MPTAENRKSYDVRFSWAVGTDRLDQKDPVYHITENFQQSFDRIGRDHALSLSAGFREEVDRETEENKLAGEQSAQETPAQDSQKRPANEPKEAGTEKPQKRGESAALTRFSEIAFQRGAMSAAVFNGTGKMMLTSCLKRTTKEVGPKHMQQQNLMDTGSTIRNIPGHTPDIMVFNRGFTDSALGIVVDTLRDARRIVESIQSMASCWNDTSLEDRTALFKIYPFLDDSRDAAMEADYREKIARCTDEREKPILQNALVRTLSLRAKKAQMKNEFINKLRFVSDRATQTLAELEAPGFSDELASAVFGYGELDLPENPDEGADGDAPNGKKDGAGHTIREAIAADTTETAG